MRDILCFLLAAAVQHLANGINYDGLRVKFGMSDALADVNYFYNIPRTIREVEAEKWRRTNRPMGPMKELRMYCPPGRIVCLLFDPAGFVAGLQIAIPEDAIDTRLKPENIFVKWTPPASDSEPSRDYWTATQFLVSPESLKAGAGPTTENGATLQDGGVWVNDLNGKLMKISLKEKDFKNTLLKKQSCINNMGTHYYHNITEEYQCDGFLPWFVMVTKGEVLGVGFQTLGRVPPKDKNRQWFEDVPKGRAFALCSINSSLANVRMIHKASGGNVEYCCLQTITPRTSECFLDQFEEYGLLSIHIYYIDRPWDIKCKPGDSMEPAPNMGVHD